MTGFCEFNDFTLVGSIEVEILSISIFLREPMCSCAATFCICPLGGFSTSWQQKFEQASLLTLRVRSSRHWRTMGNFSPFFAHRSPIFPSADFVFMEP